MPDDDFTRGDAFDIAHNCTVDVIGQDHLRDPSATLFQYGIITGEQTDLVKKDVRTNSEIGVPAYGRRIDPNALKDLTRDWAIAKLRDVVFDFSEPVPEGDILFARWRRAGLTFGRSRPDMTTMAVSAAAGMVVGFLAGRRR